MAKHNNLGDIAIAVGSYDAGGDNGRKKRYRKVGVMMETVEDDGSKRRWLRLNADIFHASLFALASRAGMKPGDDTVTAQVFEPREPSAPGAKSPPPEAPEDDIPF